MLNAYRRDAVCSICLGGLLVIAGLAAIMLPFVAGVAASILFGSLLLVAGIAHGVYAWSQRGAGAVLWQVLIGIVYLITALYLLVLPVTGVVAHISAACEWYRKDYFASASTGDGRLSTLREKYQNESSVPTISVSCDCSHRSARLRGTADRTFCMMSHLDEIGIRNTD